MTIRSRNLLLLVLVLIMLGAIAWRAMVRDGATNAASANRRTPVPTPSVTNTTTPMTDTAQLALLAESPTATIETNFGTIVMRFYTAQAPELTKNFFELAKSGYYDGLTFHRIVPGFVIQGGDPDGNGTGGHSYKGEGTGLADEPGALQLRHLKGAVAWAKSSLPNSIGSQFYIALDALTQLDGEYSVFGQVMEGMDVVERIGAVPADASSGRPSESVRIERVTVNE
ncbi:MAG: peptidylprolyl isomerase [Candidatus Kerfeldbacteria bacterium]|nr:peptidylprolyl isomerase [Candidatus Kerfeldbacteria bacterium]